MARGRGARVGEAKGQRVCAKRERMRKYSIRKEREERARVLENRGVDGASKFHSPRLPSPITSSTRPSLFQRSAKEEKGRN